MSFKPIESFNNDDIVTREVLNDIVENLDYLNDSRVTMELRTPEFTSTTNLKVVAGRELISPGRSSETINISFLGFFPPSTVRPVVSATLETTTRKRSYISVSEVRTDGFRVTVETASGEPFSGRNEIHWIAMGI